MEETTDTALGTKIEAFCIDPLTKVSGAMKKEEQATVALTVRVLAKHVVNKVNLVYSLDPPLKVEDMVSDRDSGKLYLLYFLFF